MGRATKTLTAEELSTRVTRAARWAPEPPRAWVRDALPKLLDRWGACGSFVGVKQEADRWGKKPCFVVLTQHKRDVRRGRDGISKVPAFVRWRDGSARYQLPTDVVEVPAEVQLQAAVFGPGDGASYKSRTATIGAAVDRPGVARRCLITVGHLVGLQASVGDRVRVSSAGAGLDTRLLERRFDSTIDYALLEPQGLSPCDNLFQDLLRVGTVYTPGFSDRNTRLFVLHGSGQAIPTQCIGIGHRFNLGTTSYFDTILTTAVTSEGQSGSALVDASMRLWGFLLGRVGNQFSFFAPAELILRVAGARLV